MSLLFACLDTLSHTHASFIYFFLVLPATFSSLPYSCLLIFYCLYYCLLLVVILSILSISYTVVILLLFLLSTITTVSFLAYYRQTPPHRQHAHSRMCHAFMICMINLRNRTGRERLFGVVVLEEERQGRVANLGISASRRSSFFHLSSRHLAADTALSYIVIILSTHHYPVPFLLQSACLHTTPAFSPVSFLVSCFLLLASFVCFLSLSVCCISKTVFTEFIVLLFRDSRPDYNQTRI